MSPTLVAWTPAIISATCMAVSVAAYAIQSVRMRAYERRLEQMNMLVVRSVMEESPELVKRILETQRYLVREGGYTIKGEEALRESRRLHGLDP